MGMGVGVGDGDRDEKVEKKRLQKSYLDVLGICCSAEVGVIENILKPLQGVEEVTVILPSRTLIVLHDRLLISQHQIVKALNQARLEANIRADGETTTFQKKWPSPFALACGVFLLLSFLKYVYRPFQWLALAAVAAGAWPVLRKAYASLFANFTLDINILMIIAVAGTIALGDYTESGTIVFLFITAEWLESRASHRATAVMSKLMSIAPRKAVLADTGEEVDVDEVKLNTILAVKAGEVIPIDGIVIDGKCEVDEKTLTGESFPVAKQHDSTVWAGTINLNGYISVKATSIAEDCVVAKMVKLVEEAQNSKSSTQKLIDKCSKYYTPAIILISVSIAVIPIALRVHNLKQWLHLALVVLVSACPCSLILSTPVATFCALTKAATSGVLIKGGDYLEVLSKIKITAFDKTGTLTKGEFVVTEFKSLCPDISLDTLVFWVSSIESKSSHPLASALVEYGKSLRIEPKPEYVNDYKNFPGEGISAKIDGREIYIGSRRIAERAGGTVPTFEGIEEGSSRGYIFSGAILVGTFHLSDACRTGAAEAIKELKSMDIKTAMLTGDTQAAATYVQEKLERCLAVVCSELLPEDKARIIKQLKKEGPTAMVGDGLNDAPALATADIGISMGISGSALASETAHVILMSNDIRQIPQTFRLAKRAHRKVIQNVILSISIKAAILALAGAGHPLVWAAVLADVGTCLLVILNSMLLLREPHYHTRKCCSSPSLRTHEGQCHSPPSHRKLDGLHRAANQSCKCASTCQAGASKLNSHEGHNTNQHNKKCNNSFPQPDSLCSEPHSRCHEKVVQVEAEHSDLHEHNCAETGKIQEKNCEVVLHGHSSQSVEGRDEMEARICHSVHHPSKKAFGNFKQASCANSSHPKPHPHHIHDCCDKSGEPHHTAIDITMALDNEAMHACESSKKRQIGSCCRSDLKLKESCCRSDLKLKDCCCDRQPFKPGFRGFMEIVTE